MRELDFDQLPTIQRSSLFKGLPTYFKELVADLGFHHTLARLRGAALMFSEMTASNEDWLNNVYFRAGLNEFKKVETPLSREVPSGAVVHSPEKSTNPLIHLIYRLRNTATYREPIKTSDLVASVPTIFGDDDICADVRIVIIDGINDYLDHKRLDEYHPHQLTRICEWFDENQRRFGAPWILTTGVIMYCMELHNVYS